jgi:hypothetical protein
VPTVGGFWQNKSAKRLPAQGPFPIVILSASSGTAILPDRCYNETVVNSEKLVLIWATIALLAGCVKRQAVARVDYVPATPVKAPSASTDSGQFVVIEEPPSPEPAPAEVTPPEPTTTPASAPAPVRRRKNTASPPAQEPSSEPVEIEDHQVPKLEPVETSATQSAELNRQIDEVHNRIGAQDRARLSAASLKDLDDAANFVDQSKKALAAGDLLRSSNLVHKALLLVEAVEKPR